MLKIIKLKTTINILYFVNLRNTLLLLPEEVIALAKFLLHSTTRTKDFLYETSSTRCITSRPTFGKFVQISLIDNKIRKSLNLSKEEIRLILLKFGKFHKLISKQK